ncbi:MAG TPA: hemolysin family protein [Candidatus Binataceae bacterium]|nr:hemolysin family protein [Candidatus Binataceae bacterium]
MASLLAASETALFSLVRMERTREALTGPLRTAVDRLLRRPLESLVTIIGLNEICNVFAECLSTSFLLFVIGVWGAWAAVPINFVLILLIAEITPKTFALAYPIGVAKLTARPLAALTRILHPVAQLFVPAEEAPMPEPVSETEFKALLHAGESQGQVEAAEREMIHKVFDLGGRRVIEVMTPRDMIFSLPIDTPPEALATEVARGHFSRVPIYRGDTEHIVGILHAKDVVARRLDRTPTRIERLMRPPYFVPPGKALGDLLDDMRHSHQQIAMVVNEYGRLLGLVSLEDLLEELFGELKDEFDIEVPEMTPLAGGSWSVSGSIELRKLCEVLGPHNLPLGDSGEPTLNRLVLRKLGRVPRQGERFQLGNFDVSVEKVRGASVELMTFMRAA